MNSENTLQVTVSSSALPVESVGAVPPGHFTFSVEVPFPFGHVMVLAVADWMILIDTEPPVSPVVVTVGVMFVLFKVQVDTFPAETVHVGVAVSQDKA